MFTHVRRRAALAAAARFVTGMARHGIQCLLPDTELAEVAGAVPAGAVGRLDLRSGAQGCELTVVFGGDGSILRGAEWAVEADLPLLGVNLGHVGFLAEAESSEIDRTVALVVERSYTVEERLSVRVDAYADATSERPIWSSFAVNEVSIEKAARERMLELMVHVDGHPLSRWGCDGVLLATPTGSTAYAFSAGGPVMWPQVEAVLLVPLSAHALFARPMVLAPDSRVDIDLLPGPDGVAYSVSGVVWCDGRRSVTLTAGMRVSVARGRHRLLLARLSESSFADRLVRKFGLRVEGWRGAAESGRP